MKNSVSIEIAEQIKETGGLTSSRFSYYKQVDTYGEKIVESSTKSKEQSKLLPAPEACEIADIIQSLTVKDKVRIGYVYIEFIGAGEFLFTYLDINKEKKVEYKTDNFHDGFGVILIHLLKK